MDTLLQDLRYAARALLRRPGFTAVVALTLALGIGANAAIFSVVDAVLLRPLPYREPERLVRVWTLLPQFGREVLSLPDFLDFRREAGSFAQLAAYANTKVNVTGEGEPVRADAAVVTANYFATLGTPAAVGRGFLPEEETAGRTQVVVLGHGFWRSRLGGDPGVVGRTLTVQGRPHTVVGIASPALAVPEPRELYLPLRTDTTLPRRADFLTVVGRLKPGVPLTRAQAELTAIARRLGAEYPETNTNVGVEAIPLHEQVVGDARRALLVVMGAVGLVLLIACANVANLLLARAAGREREIAVRAALGAGRRRIVRQLLTESVLLAALGGLLGVLLAVWGVAALRGGAPESLPRLAEVGVDARVLAFTAVVSLATGILFGLAPALRLARTDLRASLTDARGAAGHRGQRRLRGALVLGEVALAVVLLAGAGLLVRTLVALQRTQAGFEPAGVLTFRVAVPRATYEEDPQVRTFYDGLLEGTAALPGVRSAALASLLPLEGASYTTYAVQGRPAPPPGETVDLQPFVVSTDYFRTMGIPLVRGRTFAATDGPDAVPVAVVNQELARRVFPDEDPIGKRITLGDPADSSARWLTIVGVVENVLYQGPRDRPYPQLYEVFAQVPQRAMAVAVRMQPGPAAADPLAAAPALRRLVASLDRDLPMYDVLSMEQRAHGAIARTRVTVWLLGVFAAVALALAAVGLYGVMSYAVAQRTREIGVRLALGALPGDVVRLVVRQGMAPVLAGIAVGLVGAVLLTRLMATLLFGVGPGDPATLAAVSAFLGAVAFAATLLPARRATRVTPTVALRGE